MDYEIVKLYTERLDISSFKNSMGNENIESIAKFTTSIVPIEQSETSTFVIEYSMRGVNKPISLNWVAIAVLKQDKSDNRKLNEKILLNDEQIK